MSHTNMGQGDGPRDVVYVIASMIVGGTQTHLLQVLRFLDRRRWRPHLFCLRDEGSLIEAARELDTRVLTFSMRGTLRAPRDLFGLARLASHMRSLKPAIVHGYLLRGNFYGAVAARLAGVPRVITSKRGLHRPGSFAERAAVCVSNRLSDVITGNSPAVLEFTRTHEPCVARPLEMIPSGIDVERFEPTRWNDLRTELELGARPTIGTAITLRPRKGYRMLFEAFALILRECADATLLIAGVERLEGEPERLARELGITRSLVLLGRRDDMPRVLKTCDVFVLPSESEGMSNAVLEAMAMRLPVVATAVGGNPVVITEGQSGYLVNYGDVDALARRVVTLLNAPAERRQVGEEARTRVVEQYSARAMVRRMEDLYDKLTEVSDIARAGFIDTSGRHR